ncbi:MAG: exo-alpha-sialidase [Porticoccaceae bacterium]|nr:exo-alpha-sialidase [Porticoccaceae bacterium]
MMFILSRQLLMPVVKCRRLLGVLTLLCIAAAGVGCSDQSQISQTVVADWSSPAGARSVSPNLSLDHNGVPILSWMKVSEDSVALEYSRWDKTQWSEAVEVARGSNWLVNRADFPSVVQLSESLWAAHWLEMTDPSVFAYDVMVGLSTDGGITWNTPFRPHTDGTLTEHGFVSFFADNQDVGLVWLDGRNMSVGGHSEHNVEPMLANGGMTLRSTKITIEGALFEPQIIDGLVCDCCQTDIAQVDEGAVLVFRNRTEGEHRDIYYSQLINGRWSESKPVASDEWLIAGCPVNGPSVAASSAHTAVAWDTEGKGYGQVKLALSEKDSDTFMPALEISGGDAVLGQVGLAATEDDGFIVSWLTFSEGVKGDLNLRHADADGVLGPAAVVAGVDFTRRAGLPQMVVFDDHVILAWTGGDKSNKAIQVVSLPQSVIEK